MVIKIGSKNASDFFSLVLILQSKRYNKYNSKNTRRMKNDL